MRLFIMDKDFSGQLDSKFGCAGLVLIIDALDCGESMM